LLNVEQEKIRNKAWCQINKEHRKTYCKNWYIANLKQKQTTMKAWREKHIQQLKINYKNWVKINTGKRNASAMRRHAAKLKATPHWLMPIHFKQIDSIYAIATLLTKILKYQIDVDHIVPLQPSNSWIRGLHTPRNLQLMEHICNVRKGNKVLLTFKEKASEKRQCKESAQSDIEKHEADSN
jgi:hypothetical protein